MSDYSYEEKGPTPTIQSMLGEHKELLEKDKHAPSDLPTNDFSDNTSKVSETQYFTFLGSNNDQSILIDLSSLIKKKYTSEKLGEFFKIKDGESSPLSLKIKNLKRKSYQGINQSLKHKISEKIFKL